MDRATGAESFTYRGIMVSNTYFTRPWEFMLGGEKVVLKSKQAVIKRIDQHLNASVGNQDAAPVAVEGTKQ
jgi:hypothetical protein